MSERKRVVEQYHGCFDRNDWSGMLPLLTEDVERWEVGAPKKTRGKAEFDQEIRPGPDVVSLKCKVDRVIEEGDTVVSEGLVTVSLKDGRSIRVQFVDLFDFEGEKIKRLTAYGCVVDEPSKA